MRGRCNQKARLFFSFQLITQRNVWLVYSCHAAVRLRLVALHLARSTVTVDNRPNVRAAVSHGLESLHVATPVDVEGSIRLPLVVSLCAILVSVVLHRLLRLLLGFGGFGHVAPVHLVDELFVTRAHAKLKRRSRQNVLNIRQGICHLHQVVARNSFFQLVQLFLEEVDTQRRACRCWHRRRRQHVDVELRVEIKSLLERVGHGQRRHARGILHGR
mmetsp:Transcript_82/g.182  ORF Transcript_82/g.182 Transcript_82/m.182 type:complete len:216 (+) Transcript_82:533-1180(+)